MVKGGGVELLNVYCLTTSDKYFPLDHCIIGLFFDLRLLITPSVSSNCSYIYSERWTEVDISIVSMHK
jgi:hypothetical protein